MTYIVNARFLTQRVTGVQRHAIEVSRRLKRMVPGIRFVTPRGILHEELARELGAEIVGRRTGHAWEQLELPGIARSGLLLSLCNAAPIAVRRQVVTIHDAAPFSVPAAYSRKFRTWYRFLIRTLGRRARLIMTDSDFSAEELQRRAGIPAHKIERVYLGREHVFATPADAAILDRHELRGAPFLLTVGSSSPHKNFAALLRALAMSPERGMEVVIVGGAAPRIHLSGLEAELPPGVRHLGPVSDGELRALYEHAAGYIHPSYYEGFGLPPLEALALGCPVVCSRAGSLPEVCGEAALYFDPHNEADMADKISRFSGDGALRDALRRKGLEQAQRFSWDVCAREILDVLERTR